MRYTTVIDISEFRQLYRNHTVRLVYLHLCLKAGYHDDDRDTCSVSFRNLAYDVGISVSACRHALRQLTKSGLISRSGPLTIVRKYVQDQSITPRPKSEREKRKQDARRDERQRAEEIAVREAAEKSQRLKLEQQGKTQFMVWYEEKIDAAKRGEPDAIEAVQKYKSVYDAHAAQHNRKEAQK